VTAAPLPDPTPRPVDLDLAPMTVVAITWLAAIVATSVTLWLLVAVVGPI
jgi:hypothetical protein